jgi:hypothetical protein
MQSFRIAGIPSDSNRTSQKQAAAIPTCSIRMCGVYHVSSIWLRKCCLIKHSTNSTFTILYRFCSMRGALYHTQITLFYVILHSNFHLVFCRYQFLPTAFSRQNNTGKYCNKPIFMLQGYYIVHYIRHSCQQSVANRKFCFSCGNRLNVWELLSAIVHNGCKINNNHFQYQNFLDIFLQMVF